MLPVNKTFRVFISSTFNDLQAERNALQSLVFPRLRMLCHQHGARFQAIDLRWGVSEEASHEQDTMAICLDEITRCQRVSPRPNFLLLLGQRYGWRPAPVKIPGVLFQKILRTVGTAEETDNGKSRLLLDRLYRIDRNAQPPEYLLQPRRGKLEEYSRWAVVERDLLALLQKSAGQLRPKERLLFGKSATEQEADLGAGVPRTREHVHFFYRTISGLPPDERAKTFVDFDENEHRPDAEAARRVDSLKQSLRRRFPDNVHEYSVSWTGKKISAAHLEAAGWPANLGPAGSAKPPGTTGNLCADVYSSLADVIQRELSQWQRQDPLRREIQQHEKFSDAWGDARFFTGRKQTLRTIAEYLRADTDWPLTLHGVSGSGKSAVMARAVAEARRQHPEVAVVFRFLGVTPESSNGQALLKSLCQQIDRAFGKELSIPTDYVSLQLGFIKRLELAREERPLWLFLDALDQLSDQFGARSLNWLPQKLPPHVRIVVSTLPHVCLPVLRHRYPKQSQVEIHGLPQPEGNVLLSRWLKAEDRTLQPAQRDALLGRFAECPLPLWLKLAFAEARRWHSYARAPLLAPNVPRLIRSLFRRLSRPAEHGALLVDHSLGLIGASKNGLTEDELIDLLSGDREFFADFLKHASQAPPERRLPVVVWSRLFFDLEPYLTEREGDGTSLLAFFHRQFREVVEKSFLGESDKTERHAALARFFGEQPNQFINDDRTVLNLRRLSELPYQQRQARRWPALERTLCDLAFIEAKCTAGLTYDLIADYDAALNDAALPKPSRRRIEQFARFVKAQSNLLVEHPALTFQQAFNEPDSTVPAQAARRRISAGRERRPRLRHINKSQVPSRCLITCRGHHDYANSCDVSPDGRFIASASADEQLKIWDTTNGKELRSLTGHGASVESCAFSPDGRQIVSGGRNGEVKLWDAVSGTETVPLAGHETLAPVATVAFAPNGRWVASASSDKTIRIWDANDGRQLHQLSGHTTDVVACAFSRDSSRLVSGDAEGSLKVWNTRDGVELFALAGHEGGGVWRCAFSPDDRWIVSSSDDGTIKRWDTGTHELLGTFTGHSKAVWTCAISPDGRRLASGSEDKTVRLWDVDSGRQLALFTGHSEPIWGITFFPDGRRIASASWDWSIKIWDAVVQPTRARIARPAPVSEAPAESATRSMPHDGQINSCTCSRDGRLYAAGCADGSVRLWNSVTGAAVEILRGDTDTLTALAFSPDNQWLMVGGWYGGLKLIDVSARLESATLEPHGEIIRACTFSHDGTQAFSCSAKKIQFWQVTASGLKLQQTWAFEKPSLQAADLSPDGKQVILGFAEKAGPLRLRSVQSGEELAIGMHPDLVFCSFSPDGKQLVSSSLDGKLKSWDVRQDGERHTFTGHTGKVESCRFSPDSRRIVSSSWDHTVKVWSLDQPDKPLTLKGHTDQLQDACFTADGKKILSAGIDGTFRVWDAATGTRLGLLVRTPNSVSTCAFSRRGTQAVSASHRCSVKLWDPAKAKEQHALSGHESDVLACAFSPNERFLVSASADNTLKLWDTKKGIEIATGAGHRGPVAACVFSPDGRSIASGSWDKTVRIWDARLRKPLHILKGHRGWVQFVLFSPDGKRLISGSQDRTLRAWDVATGTLLRTFKGHRDVVVSAAFAPNGRRLVSGCADGKLKIWDTRTALAVFTLSSHASSIRACGFSPDGSQVLSAANDKTLKLWNARTGKLKTTLTGHSEAVLSCAFSKNGRRLLSTSADQFLKVWDTGTGELICSYWVGAPALTGAWHPNGRNIAVGDFDGQVHFLELQ